MLRETLMEQMRADGIEFVTNAQIVGLERDHMAPDSPVHSGTRWAGSTRNVGDRARPLPPLQLDLSATGLAADELASFATDVYQETSVPGIYAIGDVTGQLALTPVAIAAGAPAADRIFGGSPNASSPTTTSPPSSSAIRRSERSA